MLYSLALTLHTLKREENRMRPYHTRQWLSLMLTLVLLLWGLTACGGQAQQSAAPTEPAKEEAAATEPKEESAGAAAPAEEAEAGEKPTIRLAENPWSGSQVNVAVAKIL